MAEPERFITLTQVGNDWQTVRKRVKVFRHRVVQEVGACDWSWQVEPNPKGTGQHLHAWQRGDFLKQRELVRLAKSVGMGEVVDVRQWQAKGDASVTYGLKLAGIGYGLKGAVDEDSLDTYLTANGRRLVHSSRGYWRDRLGEPCGIKEARKSWLEETGVNDHGPWVIMRRFPGERS